MPKTNNKTYWEYRTSQGMNDGAMNELGAHGWELIAVGPSGALYWKRPREMFKDDDE